MSKNKKKIAEFTYAFDWSKEKDLVLYHADCADGTAAAWAYWSEVNDQAEFVAVQHGQPPPDVTGRCVSILDFSYPAEVLRGMAEKAIAIDVFDHHASAEAHLRGAYERGVLRNLVFDKERSGAGIVWDYFAHDADLVTPLLIAYVQDRDLWRFKLPCSREINAAIGTHPRTILAYEALHQELEKSHTLLQDPAALAHLCPLVREGEAILRHQAAYNAYMAKQATVHTTIVGDLVVVNAPGFGASELLHRLLEERKAVAAMAWFHAPDGSAQVSLRTTEAVNAAEVCSLLGGGGHPRAAGARLRFAGDRALSGPMAEVATAINNWVCERDYAAEIAASAARDT